MRLNVKLYGTLGRSIDGYDHLSGLDITLPEESSINDLLAHLNFLSIRLGMILMDGKPLRPKSPLIDGAQIKIFQPVFGG